MGTHRVVSPYSHADLNGIELKILYLQGLMAPSLFSAGEPSYFSSVPATLLIVLQSIIHSCISIDL